MSSQKNPTEEMMSKFVVMTDMAGYLAPLDPALFSDFLKLAFRLYSEGYKDAAVALGVGVLEGHLLKLSEKAEIAVTADNGLPKKADALNEELAAKGTYSRLDQENVSAWLGSPKQADREENNRDEVTLLLEGVRGFLDRYPA